VSITVNVFPTHALLYLDLSLPRRELLEQDGSRRLAQLLANFLIDLRVGAASYNDKIADHVGRSEEGGRRGGWRV